jgi:hypothetical protein
LQKETQGNFNFAFAKRNKATLISLCKKKQGNFNFALESMQGDFAHFVWFGEPCEFDLNHCINPYSYDSWPLHLVSKLFCEKLNLFMCHRTIQVEIFVDEFQDAASKDGD